MDWNDLRYFLSVTQEGTLGRAADALGVNESTVYRRIKALEAELGTRLVERRGRGYELTASGESLAARAASMESEVLSIEREIAGRDLQLCGTVRLTTPDTVVTLLGPHLASFRQAYPGITLDILVDNRFFVLGRGEADIAVRPGKRPTEPDVVAKPIAPIETALCASRSYLERRGRPRKRSQLSGHDFVSVDDSLAHLSLAKIVDRLGGHVVCRSSSVMGMIDLIDAGLGIGMAPEFMIESRPDIVRLFSSEREAESALWLVWHVDLRHTARVRALVDHLQTALVAQ